jgi:hypothetical protein
VGARASAFSIVSPIAAKFRVRVMPSFAGEAACNFFARV